MGKKKAPQLPMYDKYTDNIYQSTNRQLAEGLGDWLNTNYGTIDATSDAYRANQDAYIGNYNNMVRNTLAKNYSAYDNARALGGANTGLYNTDIGSLYNNDLNTRVSSSNAQQYGDLAKQYFNNQLANLAARYMQYVPSGEDINAVDNQNNNITNQNLDRQYYNNLMKEAQKGNPLNIAKSAIKGGISGFLTGGPLGALAGAAQGGIGSALNEYTDFGGIYSGLSKGLGLASGLGAAYAGFTGK